MVKIDTPASIESFRRFIITSTCSSFAPSSYLEDYEVFPERDVLGIIYNSKSGNTQLKWRQIRRLNGKVTGEASPNSLVNLAESGVITMEWVENYVRKKAEEDKTNVKEITS